MNTVPTNFVGEGMEYMIPELLVESITPETGYCGSVIDGNSNESINDGQNYDFAF